MANYEAQSNDRTAGPRSAEVVNSSLQTPASTKAGKATKTSRLTKCNKSRPQTPVSNVGMCFLLLYPLLLLLLLLLLFSYNRLLTILNVCFCYTNMIGDILITNGLVSTARIHFTFLCI